jgi:glutamate N-acetyltransferase / amino-acid N-acetyltransferase
MTDACRSTNDTVILLASGAAGPVDNDDLAVADRSRSVRELAGQMAGDAEGATKVVKLTVVGAASDADAEAGARKIAASALCKCSLVRPGPLLGSTGQRARAVAGIEIDQEKVSVRYGGVTGGCRRGQHRPR